MAPGAWRVVRSLLVLRGQVDELAPNRSKLSDGTIGDAVHQAEPTSDHNPRLYPALGPTPVVCAIDLTHDPAHGADMGSIGEQLRVSRDPRIAYVIFGRRVFSATNVPWVWRNYTGSDPHTGHLHLSTVHTAAADNPSPWKIRRSRSMFLCSVAGRPEVYLSWGPRYRRVPDPAALAALQAAGIGSCPPFPSLAAMEAVAGRLERQPVAVDPDALGELLGRLNVTVNPS